MRNDQTVIIFQADEPNFEQAKRIIKKIEGIEPTPLCQDEYASFLISSFDNWQDADLDLAICNHVYKELLEQGSYCTPPPT